MKASELKNLIGRRVIYQAAKGVLVVCRLVSVTEDFGGRAVVKIPLSKTDKTVWASKITTL